MRTFSRSTRQQTRESPQTVDSDKPRHSSRLKCTPAKSAAAGRFVHLDYLTNPGETKSVYYSAVLVLVLHLSISTFCYCERLLQYVYLTAVFTAVAPFQMKI